MRKREPSPTRPTGNQTQNTGSETSHRFNYIPKKVCLHHAIEIIQQSSYVYSFVDGLIVILSTIALRKGLSSTRI